MPIRNTLEFWKSAYKLERESSNLLYDELKRLSKEKDEAVTDFAEAIKDRIRTMDGLILTAKDVDDLVKERLGR